MIQLEKRPYSLNDTAICIGKFDGLHEGHRLLADALDDLYTKVMFTFQFEGKNDQIYTETEKVYICEKAGFDVMIQCPFDKDFMNLSPIQFVEDVLVKDCGAKQVAVGEDFRFGQNRQGDVNLLQELSEKYGFKLCVLPKKKMDEVDISSTRIRKLLHENSLQKANQLLGSPYFVMGEVVYGNQIGRTLDMPTANLNVPEGKIIPSYGVYATKIYFDGQVYIGVTNIGEKPTIPGQNKVGIETNIIDFSDNIYGKMIRVEFHHFLRGEQKFSGLDELKKQMDLDKKATLDFFSKV